jgi:hypothetical protein
MAIEKDLLDQLLAGRDPKDVFNKDGLVDELKKALSERILNTELDEHLDGDGTEGKSNHRNGYSKKSVLTGTSKMTLSVPRDRAGTFDPKLIAKYQRRFPDFDNKIISMYARGMTVREIRGHLEELYGIEVSPDLISAVTDAVLEEVAEWQNRPLDLCYPLVFFDAIRVKVRDEGFVRNKAIYIALGVLPDGTKGPSINNSFNSSTTDWYAADRRDRVIPLAVESVRTEVDGCKLRVVDLDALGIFVCVKLRAHLQARIGGGGGDELNDGAIAAQRFASPVDGNEREEPVLDLVPLAGARRQMADGDGKFEFVGKLLKLDLPQTNPIAVAAPAIGRDHELGRIGMTFAPHGLPPAANRMDGKACRVVIGADAHPAQVVGDVVDTIGHCAGKLGIDEVVNIDQIRLALGTPLPTVVLEIAHQFLLFRINRDDGLVRGQEPLGVAVDVAELRVTIDVSATFFDFAVGLKTVAQPVQKLAHHRGRDLVSLLGQRA